MVEDGYSMKHYFENVPGLGNVAVSRHAQERVEHEKISEKAFEETLMSGLDTPEGMEAIGRERGSVRLIIIVPTPFRGAKLVKTVFRVKAQARVR
jgi:hypothetical protein